jgi:hypothetical protein
VRVEFMQILYDVINDLSGAARPVEIKLFGEQLDVLEDYGRRLAEALELDVPSLIVVPIDYSPNLAIADELGAETVRV